MKSLALDRGTLEFVTYTRLQAYQARSLGSHVWVGLGVGIRTSFNNNGLYEKLDACMIDIGFRLSSTGETGLLFIMCAVYTKRMMEKCEYHSQRRHKKSRETRTQGV